MFNSFARQFKSRILLTSTSFFLFSIQSATLSFAYDMDQAFDELRDSGENYEIIGTVCEQVARLELKRVYSERKFFIETGIRYFNKARTIGELDVVVLDRITGVAVLVGEVKCWQNLPGALRKAREQRARFLGVLEKDEPVMFAAKAEQYNWNQFVGTREFISISQDGGQNVGFDRSIENSLEELMDLRLKLINCQNAGQCKRAM